MMGVQAPESISTILQAPKLQAAHAPEYVKIFGVSLGYPCPDESVVAKSPLSLSSLYPPVLADASSLFVDHIGYYFGSLNLY